LDPPSSNSIAYRFEEYLNPIEGDYNFLPNLTHEDSTKNHSQYFVACMSFPFYPSEHVSCEIHRELSYYDPIFSGQTTLPTRVSNFYSQKNDLSFF
jgi:hypothetical protein